MAQQIKKKKANNVSVVSSCDVCAFVRCKKKKKKGNHLTDASFLLPRIKVCRLLWAFFSCQPVSLRASLLSGVLLTRARSGLYVF